MHARDDQVETRGFALPAAVLALVVVGVLVTGGFFVSRQQMRIGMASERAIESFYLAERGENEVISLWDPSTFVVLDHWESATMDGTADGGTWSVEVTKMTDRLYLLESTGSITAGESMYGAAGRKTGRIARTTIPSLELEAALTTVGNLHLGGSSRVIGLDSIPSGWGGRCPTVGPDVPGIIIDDVSNIKTSGNTMDVHGNPEVEEDPELTSDDLLDFGEQTWAELTSLANIRLAAGTNVTQLIPDSVEISGRYVCDKTNPFNWGDPYRIAGACGTYFPMIARSPAA